MIGKGPLCLQEDRGFLKSAGEGIVDLMHVFTFSLIFFSGYIMNFEVVLNGSYHMR